MAAEYDENGEYKYPEGFDPETNEWLEGFEAQREAWEAEYAKAHARWEAHREQIKAHAQADATASATETAEGEVPATYSSAPADAAQGTLAADEALAALREKLTGQ
jgi:small subunit ribosomal protein S1